MTWNVAGINFAHFHMGDQLALVEEHPDAELVAICDEDPNTATLSLESTAAEFELDDDQVYRDHEQCLTEREIDLVITCPVPTEHTQWVERLASHDVDIQLEKPFATSVAECDRAITAAEDAGIRLAINWPMAWYPSHRTAKRLIDEGRIGQVIEVHYYGGNRGGHRFENVAYGDGGEMHFAGDMDAGGPAENVQPVTDIGDAWWHHSASGGGSMIDYLGYGTTLGTWFRNGRLPESVIAGTFTPDHLAVDTHCIAVAHYDDGLSKYETRWGTFTDPWDDQPHPKCGFVLVGTEGTIASYDYEETIRVQDDVTPAGTDVAVDELEPPLQNPVQYMIDRLETDRPIEFGPLTPSLCRTAQRINDAAAMSADRGYAVSL